MVVWNPIRAGHAERLRVLCALGGFAIIDLQIESFRLEEFYVDAFYFIKQHQNAHELPSGA